MKWEAAGEISSDEKAEIVYLATTALINMWRPLIYIIPRQPVEARLKLVPPAKRAGVGLEFILSDLQRSEFDVIEL